MQPFTRIRMTLAIALAAFLLLAVSPRDSQARIKLVTLPDRDKITMQLCRGDTTLVEEQRVLNLKRGENLIDFAWQNTSIDGSSVQIRIVEAGGTVNVLNVSYPPGESALTWEVNCEKDGPVLVRISYLIQRFGRDYSYLVTADNKETELTIRCYTTVKNWTGERFADLMVKLGFGSDFTTDLDNLEARKRLSAKFLKIPVRKDYTFDHQWGEYARMFYHIENTKANRMGTFALKSGKARIYIKDSKGEEVFLGEDWGAATPRGETMDLFVGLARDIKIKRKIMENINFNHRGRSLHDNRKVFLFEIENFKDQEITLQLKEHFDGGEWKITKSDMDHEILDTENATFSVKLPARQKDAEEVKKITVQYTVESYNIW